MDTKIRQGLGLLVVAAIAVVTSMPAWGADEPGLGVWGALAGTVALVCGVVGLVFLAVGLLGNPHRD